MKGETIAWVVIIITAIIDITDSYFNFLPPAKTGYLSDYVFYAIIGGGAFGYLLVKHAVKEALDEKQ